MLLRHGKSIVILSLTLSLWRCAGSQQQGQQEAVNQSQQQALNQQANMNMAEQGEAVNNAVEAESEPTDNFNASAAADNQAPLNNAALNTGGFSNTPPADLGGSNAGLSQSTPVNNSATLNAGAAAAITEATAPTDATSAATPPTTTAGGAAASTLTNPHMNWPGKGRVKYVRRTISKHAQPNGPVVGQFEQGDHPLIFQDGNWVEVSDGTYVQGSELSEKGIPRPKKRHAD